MNVSFSSMIKLLKRVVEINKTSVTGQSLPPKNDFEHARGLRNSAYAVNLTYETYQYTDILKAGIISGHKF